MAGVGAFPRCVTHPQNPGTWNGNSQQRRILVGVGNGSKVIVNGHGRPSNYTGSQNRTATARGSIQHLAPQVVKPIQWHTARSTSR